MSLIIVAANDKGVVQQLSVEEDQFYQTVRDNIHAKLRAHGRLLSDLAMETDIAYSVFLKFMENCYPILQVHQICRIAAYLGTTFEDLTGLSIDEQQIRRHVTTDKGYFTVTGRIRVDVKSEDIHITQDIIRIAIEDHADTTDAEDEINNIPDFALTQVRISVNEEMTAWLEQERERRRVR